MFKNIETTQQEDIFLKNSFFCIEGIDGSGKSTQIKILEEKLKSKGYSVEVVREPGGCRLSEQIRDILLSNQNNGISSMSEFLLFMASRCQLIQEVILPKLKKKSIILADRFVWSTIAYQGYGGDLNSDLVTKICFEVCGSIYPKHTFLLQLSVEEMKQRLIAKVHDRMESHSDSFFEKVIQGYQECSEAKPNNFTVIPAIQPLEVIAELIWNKVKVILENRND